MFSQLFLGTDKKSSTAGLIGGALCFLGDMYTTQGVITLRGSLTGIAAYLIGRFAGDAGKR